MDAAPLGRALAGAAVSGVDLRVRRPDGESRWLRVDATPVRTSCGPVEAVVLVVRDSSRDRDEANAAKSRFIAALSHEVRTPLTAIVGYADMLAAELGGPLTAAQRHQVERVKTSAWHTVSVLEQILTYTRASGGMLEVTADRADLGDVIRDAVGVLAPLAADRGIRLDVQLPSARALIVTDIAKVRQILLNLLSNAVKFTDGATVRIVCAHRHDGYETVVQDEGPGIGTEERERIFELFQRDGIQRSDASGTGIGLPLSRELARLLGGDLTLEPATGRGSCFLLRLPGRTPGS